MLSILKSQMQLKVKAWNIDTLPDPSHAESAPRRSMRVLHFAPRVCWPLDTGAKLRNYHLARVLAQQAKLTLLAFTDDDQSLGDLANFCERVITVKRDPGYTLRKIVRGAVGRTPLPVLNYTTDSMKQALQQTLDRDDFDLVQVESIHLVAYLPIIRAARSHPLIICDWHNIESELMLRYSERERDPLRRVYARQTARKIRELERLAMSEFDAHVVVSERDGEQLRRIDPRARVFVVENGVDSAYYADNRREPAQINQIAEGKSTGAANRESHASARRRLLFVGSMNYHANIDAVVSFALDVWPSLRHLNPKLVFTIVGRDPSAEVRELASSPVIEVTGTVDDVRPFYREAVAAIVPLRVGGGSRLKILEALAAGVPVISTTIGAEGIAVRHGENILIADDEIAIRDAILSVADDEGLREKLCTNGRALIAERYEWSRLGVGLSAVHQSLIKTRVLVEPNTIKLLAIVEATTVNAVAKNMLDFHRTVEELQSSDVGFPRVELSLLTFDRSRDSGATNQFVSAARSQGLEVSIIPERGRFDLNTVSALRKLVEAHAPDVLLTHSVKSHFLVWRSGLWKRIPWVAFHHGYTATDAKMGVYNKFDRWSLPHADRVITVCEAFAHELAAKRGVSPERIFVRPNSIRPATPASSEAVQTLKKKWSIGVDERVVLSVGRLSREKAHNDLLHVFKLLLDSNSELKAKLVIVGDGPERAKLETTAASLGIAGSVVFVGQVNDVETFYGAADVLVNPSHSEGSPYVLLEAMAAGVPIIATAVGGVPEILKDGESALLVPPREPRTMAAAMIRLLSNRGLARELAANASALATSCHSPATYVDSVVGVYRDVLLAGYHTELPEVR